MWVVKKQEISRRSGDAIRRVVVALHKSENDKREEPDSLAGQFFHIKGPRLHLAGKIANTSLLIGDERSKERVKKREATLQDWPSKSDKFQQTRSR